MTGDALIKVVRAALQDYDGHLAVEITDIQIVSPDSLQFVTDNHRIGLQLFEAE